MVQTNRVAKHYAENLIDPYLTFDEVQTWTVSSGTGSSYTDTQYAFNGLMSLKIENTDPTNNIVVTNSTQNTVFNRKTDNVALSFYLLKSDASFAYSGHVEIYKNAVLLDTQTFDLADSDDGEWYRFMSDTTYSLVTTDVITFKFQLDGIVGHGGTSQLFIDGIMLYVADDRLNVMPPLYNEPNANNALPTIPTTNGIYLLEVDNGTHTWTDERNYTGWVSYIDDVYSSGSPLTVSSATDTIIQNNAATIIDGQKPTDVVEFYFSGGLVLSGVSGTFEVDEVITGGTSGATATLRSIDGGDYYFVDNSSTAFQTSETITGGTSGATGTVSSLLDPIITGRNGDGLALMLYFQCEPSSSNAEIDVWVDIGGSVGELYRQTFYFRTTSAKSVLYALPAAYTLNTFEANGGKIYINSSVNCDIYGFNFNFVRTHKAR